MTEEELEQEIARIHRDARSLPRPPRPAAPSLANKNIPQKLQAIQHFIYKFEYVICFACLLFGASFELLLNDFYFIF